MLKINPACGNTLWNTAKKAAKSYEYLIFDPIYTTNLENNLKAGKSVSASFKNSYNATKAAVGKDNLFKRIWNSLKGIGPEYKKMDVKGLAARYASKTGKNLSFFAKVGKFLKPLTKRMPLIANVAFVAMEIPNIYNAFTKGGIGTGIGETVKSATKFGAFTIGAAIGTALLPPLGGIIGGIAAGWVADKLLGKSFTEKQEEAKEKATDATTGADRKAQAETPDARTEADRNAKQLEAYKAKYSEMMAKPAYAQQNYAQAGYPNYSQGAYPQLGTNPFGNSDYMNEDFMAMSAFGKDQRFAA